MKRWKKFLFITIATLIAGYFIFTVCINQYETKLVDLSKLNQSQTALIAYDTPISEMGLFIMDELPPLSNDSYETDLCHVDLSNADLSKKASELLLSSFDDNTIWPSKLPHDFDPQKIMEIGKNPGLGIRNLHAKGITGKGVGIAIIDQGLLPSHEQYRNNLKVYELIHCVDQSSTMHGAAVASIAVGKDTGVAPGATLYYMANTFAYFLPPFGYTINLNYIVQSIDRILEINRSLPDDSKIRVISVSRGFSDQLNIGGKALKEAIDRAELEGIFVITTSPDINFDFSLGGLGRNALDDPDKVYSYLPGSWWAQNYYEGDFDTHYNKMLLVPMDCRTTASPSGNQSYAYYYSGGLSWSVPWLAGMYAICAQMKPDITPDEFVSSAFETGDIITIERNETSYSLGTIINPEKLISRLQSTE